MINIILEYVLYLAILIALAIPLGIYISKVMDGKKVFCSKILKPCEKGIYRLLHVQETEDMTSKQYIVAVFIFSIIGFVVLVFIQMFQGVLPVNPNHIKGLTLDLAINTAVSFITNTNWQAYSGESQMSYFTQAIGLSVWNFLSAGIGIAVLYALVRGFMRVKAKGIGNFWVDITRVLLYFLIPLALIESVFLVSQGVVQTSKASETVQLLEPVAVDKTGNQIQNATINNDGTVTVENKIIKGATVITKEEVPLGYAASQISIKQLGTNGGGYYGANSAHPFENPTWASNLVEMLSILLIPASLCFAFGRTIKDKGQGRALFAAMFIVLVIALASFTASELYGTTALTQNQQVYTGGNLQSLGNMEGKESRFGLAASDAWSVFTTAASSGSVNAQLDSMTPLGGMIAMLLIQLGEVIFGGVGSGLYGMLAFVILTVFMAGLMVGRTPEFLGKKIEPFEMKWAVLICLSTPIAALIGSGIAVMVPSISSTLTNGGAHGFSEILFAYSSAAGNNGSAFGGLNGNTVFYNISLAIVMAFSRYLAIFGVLAIAGNIAGKKKVAVSAGTLSTKNGLFIFLLIFVILLIGALSFFPALALGPLAEFFG